MNKIDKRSLLKSKVDSLPNKASLLADYYDLANSITSIFHYDIRFSILSSSYDISELPNNMRNNIDAVIRQDNFIFILMDMLMDREVIAFSLYKEFYKNNSSMILYESTVLTDDDLYAQYTNMGCNYGALMDMNADNWLQSTDLLL